LGSFGRFWALLGAFGRFFSITHLVTLIPPSLHVGVQKNVTEIFATIFQDTALVLLLAFSIR
jgi:hypothetical protein